ncbi:DUF2865 domain-containing protein [Chelativorans salis]|uniref:DUF2865 domain-containing protein n=1 Tax=Chelativorans salis TaxID=2978478 RepID=A0ABT2LMG7_9HYPH|nr:DUF2865 domain-containing protein [Chelativorans sp. EGI FJ00035]MCT7375496.1 DUF2865 domain-containing protein [Chelativorans sp. EGI FJ00035]
MGGRKSVCACMCGAALLAFSVMTGEAAAQSRICRNLEAQLSVVPRAASRAQIDQYDRAIARQETELARARESARRARCGGVFGGRNAQCPALTSTIRRMTDNLADLKRKRSAMGGGNGRQQRARLLAALEQNGCRGAATATKPPRQRRESADRTAPKAPLPPAGATYRTMCVRLCDGYYFPISFSVPPSLFQRDTKTCRARCPQADTALYVHRVPQEESDEMVSARDGTPYRDLGTAFAYRTASSNGPACGCKVRKPEGYTVVAGENEGLTDEPEEDAVLSSPAQTQGSIVSFGREEQPVEKAPVTADTGERRVRVVGPEFFPDLEEAIDLRAPAPTPAP